MRNEDSFKVKKLLLYGMIGAVLTMIGDCLLLGVDSVGAAGALGQYILAAEKISYTRIGLAGSFGFAGIPVTAFGFYALYELMEDKTSALARVYKSSVYGFVAFGGHRDQKSPRDRNRSGEHVICYSGGTGRICGSLLCYLYGFLFCQCDHTDPHHRKGKNTASPLDVAYQPVCV